MSRFSRLAEWYIVASEGYDTDQNYNHSQERIEMATGVGDAATSTAKDTNALKSTESCMFNGQG
jgi:hypothetical protein